MTNKYQFVFILPEGGDKQVDAVEASIKKIDGKVEKKETWGKKSFSYLINKQISGHYFDWEISVDTTKIKELRTFLNLNQDLVRYLLLKQD